MPTVFMMMKPCAVCGTEGRCADIGAPGLYHGPRDLDTRPSVSQRSSIYMWVQRCAACGYCAVDIARSGPGVEAIVKSKVYQAQLNDSAYSESANSFLCRAMILEQQGDWVQAGWAAVYAAWVCDDSGFDSSAQHCRLRAVELFRRAQAAAIAFAPDRGQESLLLIDLLRRARKFDEARKLCDVESELGAEERAGMLLQFEMDLIEDRDSSIHTEAEGLED